MPSFPFPPLPFLPPLTFLISLLPLFPSLPLFPPLLPVLGLRERLSFPRGFGRSLVAKRHLVHFGLMKVLLMRAISVHVRKIIIIK